MSKEEYLKEPIDTFTIWLHKQLSTTKNSYSSSCVLSTQGLDGFPNARTVSLKSIENHCLIITGTSLSRKGKEIAKNPKVALTFWWEETKRQVRIQGIASTISEEDAHFFFNDRNYESQVISSISNQGAATDDIESLRVRFRESVQKNDPVKKPSHWSGWKITPHRIEFLEFNPSRFHDRRLYIKTEDGWDATFLEP